MERHSQNGLRTMVLAAAMVSMGRPAAASEPVVVVPTVVVHLVDLAGVPARVLIQAQHEASRIYRNVGVDIQWDDATAAGDGAVAPRRILYVMLVPAKMGDKIKISRSALGVAVTSPTSRGKLVYILYDRVERFAGTVNADVALVLGHTVAHELGHLLLPAGHSATGLMRADWDRGDLSQAARGRLKFSPEEVVTIRTRLALAQ